MSRPPSIGLVQLPLPDADPGVAAANVPLAAGCLASFAVARGAARAEDIAVLPRDLAGHGGDEAVIRWVQDRRFDLAGFTTYLWNLERNLRLAEQIRCRSPSTRIIFGGPEIVAGQPVLSSQLVDSLVTGEGEQAFVQVIGDLAAGRPLGKIYPSQPALDLATLPNPYVAGFVERGSDDPLYLETLRGCPHRCTYCFYAKEFEGVRSFPEGELPRVFAWAAEHRVPEIYLMDPTFNAFSGWEGKLQAIAAANTAGIHLHTELRLESVDARRAALLALAGVRSVEVGLQSTNHEALHAVRRTWNRDRFLRGARLLAEAGIAVRTGVILGLPRDTAEGFRNTVEFLEQEGLASGMEVYPLSVLPGTDLRRDARRLGIDHMPFPPYWVLSTETMSSREIEGCIRWLEDTREVEFFEPVAPAFADPRLPHSDLIGFLDLREPGALADARLAGGRLANRLTLLVDDAALLDPARREELERFGSWLIEATPSSLYQLVIESEGPLEAGLLDRVAESFYNPGHFFNRCHHFSRDPQGRYSVRLFRLARDPRSIDRGWRQGEACEPILRYTPGLVERARSVLEEQPFILLAEEPCADDRRDLARLYDGQEELLLRSDRPV